MMSNTAFNDFIAVSMQCAILSLAIMVDPSVMLIIFLWFVYPLANLIRVSGRYGCPANRGEPTFASEFAQANCAHPRGRVVQLNAVILGLVEMQQSADSVSEVKCEEGVANGIEMSRQVNVLDAKADAEGDVNVNPINANTNANVESVVDDALPSNKD